MKIDLNKEKTSDDLNNDRDKIYYDNTNYTDFEHNNRKGNKLLPVLSLAFSIISLFYLCGGFLSVAIVFSIISLITGIISIARKKSFSSYVIFAWIGVIIALLSAGQTILFHISGKHYSVYEGSTESSEPESGDDM